MTFLFTDIEGSTRLWQQDEEAMRVAVARHDELLHQAVADRGGEVFSTMGDGVAAAFPSASSAVAAALAAQRSFAAENWPTSSPVRVRMGLHTGEAERRVDDRARIREQLGANPYLAASKARGARLSRDELIEWILAEVAP